MNQLQRSEIGMRKGDNMSQQAKAHGANAIINLRIETTNISIGKSLMSILLYGTAVIIRPNNNAHADEE